MKHRFFLIAAVCAAVSIAAVSAGAQTADSRLSEQAELIELEKSETGYGQIVERQRSSYDIPQLEKAIDPDQYVLGPYDRLLVNLIGPESRTFTMVVLPEGDVFFPGIGAIRADGMTLTEFREKLNKEIFRYFKNVQIFCYLHEPRIFRVFVTGEVKTPGAVSVSAAQRVTDAIELAGSIISEGSNRRVHLIRGGDTLNVDVLRYVVKGDFSTNPFLSNGDRIHVPIARFHAVIRGAVQKPRYYEILPEETISDIIDLAGGFDAGAIKDSVLVTRIDKDGSINTTQIQSFKFDTVLEDRDEINVLDGMTGKDRVYVFGATVNTGYYFVTKGEGLRSLLGRIAIFNDDVDLTAATLERKTGELIKVDLSSFVPPSTAEDVTMIAGDILHIPTVDQTVAVGGQVQMPGRVSYVSNWTVAQYIGAVGGPTSEGSIDRVEVISKDGTYVKTGRTYYPNSGDVIIVKRSKTRIFSDIFSGLLGVGTLIISIVALTN